MSDDHCDTCRRRVEDCRCTVNGDPIRCPACHVRFTSEDDGHYRMGVATCQQETA